MGDVRTELLLVSDFNLANFAGILRSRESLPWTPRLAPLNQVVSALSAPTSSDASALVWTRPERISAEFQRALQYVPADVERSLAEVDGFADVLLNAARHHRQSFVPTWQIPLAYRSGVSEMRYGQGLHGLLAQMNMRLAQRVADAPNIHLMHTARWLQQAGDGAWSDRLWYMTKTPFSNAVFQAAAADLQAMADQLSGRSVKLIVLDLDDTLWGGIVGDDGWENLHLGGHDATGESFTDFQRTLKGLKERGILLAIASKNDEAVALEAIDKHPEMVLRRDDFVAMRIDWNDKASNIADMVRSLNIGLQSVLFIDDNPVERSRVREFLPEVHVPEWPANKLLYDSALRSLPLFNLDTLSAEDTQRTKLYQDEAERERTRAGHTDVEDWLRSLETEVVVAPLNDADFTRVHQLFGKTNQFNLTTYRWTEHELRERMADPLRPIWSFRVRDKFGDAGLTGILGLYLKDPSTAVISDLVLSCRVMGRKVEETLLHVATEQARNAGKIVVRANFIPTPKNKPCLEFLQRSGFDQAGASFTWHTDRRYERPSTLALTLGPSPV